MATIRGGEKLRAALRETARRFRASGTLKVGFLEGATYPDGTSVAMVAAVQNFGAPSQGIPARPFFSDMVANKQDEWGPAIAGLLEANGGNVDAALAIAGEAIVGQLKQSIVDTNAPPLAESTIARKGHDKPLVETRVLINSPAAVVVPR